MELNEKLVKVSTSLVTIEGNLKLGDDVQILLSGAVTDVKQRDNGDGTYDEVYFVKGIIAYVNEEAIE